MRPPHDSGSLLSFTTRWRVRSYELDGNGHVNNSVYLAYAEEVATLHAEGLGFGRQWTLDNGGTWVVHKHEIVYHRPAVYGDELELTTRVTQMRGARGLRATSIRLLDGQLVADITTEWVWVRISDGRPTRVPEAMVRVFYS
ncbi:MAG TPA: thioesterase family protein [Chloroflexota bacterium]|jgi:acyl-CoA thioester hydrolase|nr:thioesterase family protein [Chloroflexota bacterium]